MYGQQENSAYNRYFEPTLFIGPAIIHCLVHGRRMS